MVPSFLTIPIDFGFEWPPHTDCWVPARKTCNSHAVMGSCLATRPSKRKKVIADTELWQDSKSNSPVCFWGRYYATVSEYHTWDRRSAAKGMGPGISSSDKYWGRKRGKPLIKNRGRITFTASLWKSQKNVSFDFSVKLILHLYLNFRAENISLVM